MSEIKIGEVGYTFRKKFHQGWFTGTVTKIRKGAAQGRDRRCVYEDGDVEDLSVSELRALFHLDPKNKNKLLRSRSRSTSPKQGGIRSSNSSVSSSNRSVIRRSGREITPNVRHSGYQLVGLKRDDEKEDDNVNDDRKQPAAVAIRKSSREKRPPRTYDEVLIAEQHMKQMENNNKRSSISSSTSGSSKYHKIRKLLSSLEDDDIPVDKAAESTYAQSQEEPMTLEDINDELDSTEQDYNEWLERVASQLGARPISSGRNSGALMLADYSGTTEVVDADRRVEDVVSSGRNSVLGKSEDNGAKNELEAWQLKMATVQHQQQQSLEAEALADPVPSSVLVSHKSSVPPPGSVRTLIDIDKGSRHEYLVFNKDDPDRIVGEVIVEGTKGWVEVCFGGEGLVKCRSSHLIVLPRYKFNIGDRVPVNEYVMLSPERGQGALKSSDDSKSSCSGEKKGVDKKTSLRSKQHSVDLDDIFYWVCECNAFNTTTDRVCQSCHADRNTNAKVSKLLEIAEEVVRNEYVSSLEEALVQISEVDRPSIPESILAKLLEAKVAGLNLSQVAATKPCTKIESFFYWSCGSCTMLNSYRKGFCQTCREARGYFARSSPLFAIAEKIALDAKSPEDAYAKWPAHETRQIPEVVMDSLITCVQIIRRKGYEKRCRNRKLVGFDYCKDHCDPALLTASRVDDAAKQADKVGSDADGEDVNPLQPMRIQHRKASVGIETMKLSLHEFLTTKIDTVRNKLGWSINNIEDSLICESDSKPFPLGLKVRTYFLGYGFHDGRIIKVRRQFKDDRPVLVYRVIYNDGDQQDYLHYNIASLRQVYDVNGIDPDADVEHQIPVGSLFELKSGVIVEVIGHSVSPQSEQFISFSVEDDLNGTKTNLELSILKFQVAVKRKIDSKSDGDPVSAAAGGAVLEWPVSQDRIEAGNGIQYKVCNGLHLLSKSHNVDYSLHPIQKLPNVDDPRDARPGVKMPRYDPANMFHYTHWDPSQCLVCELCGIDKDDNQVVICEECHLGFHAYCLRPVMVNIPTSEWTCRECSGRSNSISFADFSKSLAGQQESVLQFLNLPYNSYKDFINENAEAVAHSRAPTPFNSSQHTAIDRNLFSVGPILFVRAPDRHDFRLPPIPATEEEYASVVESFVAAMKYCGMSKYSEANIFPENGSTTEDMNNSELERDTIAPLSKRNLSIFRAFKENIKRGVFPPIKVVYDEKYGFSVEAMKTIPQHTLISEYTGEVITLDESSESDSLMILLDSGDPKTSLIIDPTNAGNVARFLSGVNNKSLVSKRKANVRTRRFCLDGKIRVALFTSKRIEPGEKLNYDYNAGRQGKSSEEWLKGGFYDTSNFF